MAKQSREELEKVTLNLYEGDRDILAAFYPALGWSVAARKILHRFCDRLRQHDTPVDISQFIDSIDVKGIEDVQRATRRETNK